MDGLVGLATRIRELEERAAQTDPGSDPELVAELDDALSEGYAHALAGDAHGRRLGSQIEHLLGHPGVEGELAHLRRQRMDVSMATARLRKQLARVGEQFSRLGAGSV